MKLVLCTKSKYDVLFKFQN